MSLVEARERRDRLRNPPNAVRDYGIDLKRKVIPIQHIDEVHAVAVNTWEVFGPKLRTADDLAFGPIVHPVEKEEPPPRLTVYEIQRVVSRYYNVSKVDLLSERRTANIVRPRQVAMYLSRKLTLRSFPYIGLRFGGRDHTTALHAVGKIEALRLTNQRLDAELIELESMFVASPTQSEDARCSSPQTTAT
jgi:hypothetical protein